MKSRIPPRRMMILLIAGLHVAAAFVWLGWFRGHRQRLLRNVARRIHFSQVAGTLHRLLAGIAPRPVFAHGPGGENRNHSVPDHYETLEQLYARIRQLPRRYPNVVALDTIGYSTALHLPILALKVSDYPRQEEDETAVLFSGLHHAREPLGSMMCLEIAERLAAQYMQNVQITRLVEQLEIWIVPVVNPDGYKYLMDNQVPFPWWRKNLRDNDGDGRFDPLIDGVDLNRNYNFNWKQGGEGNPASWFYRGRKPTSESEIEAMQKLALRENVVCGISFHTYGEVVLYPWANYYPPPDSRVILDVAKNLARRMTRLASSETYGILPLNGRVGQSSVWLYGRLRSIDFIVELGQEHFPERFQTYRILQEGFKPALYLLQRARRSGLWGHVRDAETGEPIAARVLVKGQEASFVSPRRGEPVFGRYERLLLPGHYQVEFGAEGYRSRTLHHVEINENELTYLEIQLRKKQPHVQMSHH